MAEVFFGVRVCQECKEQLLDRGVAEDSCSAARAIGYRQALEHLYRWQADPSAATPDDVVRLRPKPCARGWQPTFSYYPAPSALSLDAKSRVRLP